MIRITRRAQAAHYSIRDPEIASMVTARKKAGERTLELNIGDPGAYDGAYGFAMPAHIKKGLVDAIGDDGHYDGYANEQGEPALRQAVAQYSKSQGISDAKEENVVAGNGLSELIDYLFGVAVEKGVGVVLPRPDYPLYTARVNWYEGQPNYYELDHKKEWAPDIASLENAIGKDTFAVVLINPSNPTGATIERDALKAIIDVVADKGNGEVAIISDEIYHHLRFEGKHTATASLTKSVPVITLDGLSKGYYSPGWRVGHALFSNFANDTLKKALVKVCAFRLSANKAVQHAYAAGIAAREKNSAEYSRMLSMLKERAKYASERLNSIDGIECVPPKGAFYAFPHLLKGPWGTDKEFVVSLLSKEGVRVVPGSGFAMNPYERFFRVVTLPDIGTQKQAYDKIDGFVKGANAN
ncbi:MAG: aminotransferase class I/II-fold pyridoxal phosphate-dependent enzyme [Candidatus Micrarchaeota archaeon]